MPVGPCHVWWMAGMVFWSSWRTRARRVPVKSQVLSRGKRKFLYGFVGGSILAVSA